MKESNFIKQNKEKWVEFDDLNSKKSNDPVKLSKLFIQITDDLSYARTFYKNRQVRNFLNNISQSLFINIYKNSKLKKADVFKFWKITLPLVMFQARKEFLFAFLLFLISFLIGMISSAEDPGFARLILSDGYIQMTLENIKNNDPMGVYKKSDELNMLFGITINNLLVSTMTFVMGVFASIGTVMIMMYNGIMVGTFQFFFIERGLFWDSFLTIWQHGTLEISSIIIAGTAGITMGKGLIFPGTYRRFQAFRISARRGLMILAGIAPIIIFAAFIESFFTRYTEMPDFVRLFVIIISFAFIVGYFVIYPFMIARKLGATVESKESIEFKAENNFKINEFYSGGQLFENTLQLVKKHFSSFIKMVLILALLYTCIYGIEQFVLTPAKDRNLNFLFVDMGLYYDYTNLDSFCFVYNIVFQSIMALFSFYLIFRVLDNPENKTKYIFDFLKKSVVSVLIGFVLLHSIIFIPSNIKWLLFVLIIPILIVFSFMAVERRKFYFSIIPEFWQMIQGEFWKIYGLVYKFIILGILFIILLNTQVFERNISLLFWNLSLTKDAHSIFVQLFFTFLINFIVLLCVGVIAVSIGLFYFSMRERFFAENLKQKINEIGKDQKILGYEREK